MWVMASLTFLVPTYSEFFCLLIQEDYLPVFMLWVLTVPEQGQRVDRHSSAFVNSRERIHRLLAIFDG